MSPSKLFGKPVADSEPCVLVIFKIYTSPPSKYKNQLIDFLMLQITKIRTANPKASFILGGDRNSIPLDVFSHQFNKTAINEYLNKTVDTISRTSAPGLHKALKKMGTASGETDKGNFNLDEHEGLSEKQIADDLGKFFSSISKEFAPLSEQLLPDRVLAKLASPSNPVDSLKIEPYQVHKHIKSMNLPAYILVNGQKILRRNG